MRAKHDDALAAIVRRRKILKREMIAYTKVRLSTNRSRQVIQRWKRQYEADVVQVLLFTARDPTLRRIVAAQVIFDRQETRRTSRNRRVSR